VTLSAVQSTIAGEVDVLAVSVKQTSSGIYRFDVSVKHADTGWDHYADNWQILGPNGAVIGARVLHHPHVSEQPFTRSLQRVEIPDAVESVIVRAHDSVQGNGGAERTVKLKR
tara:strand:+ start:1573 stop:1911 length:339 start_codon:yes stop_codon:yes gene_type:complete